MRVRLGTAGAAHDVRDAKTITDFDEFAAGDDDFVTGGEFVEDEIGGGGVVVDGEAAGVEQVAEQTIEVVITAAAAAFGQVVFEIGVAGNWRDRAERGTTEVRVKNDAGSVDDGAQRGLRH